MILRKFESSARMSTTHKIKLSFSVGPPQVTSTVPTFPQFRRRKLFQRENKPGGYLFTYRRIFPRKRNLSNSIEPHAKHTMSTWSSKGFFASPYRTYNPMCQSFSHSITLESYTNNTTFPLESLPPNTLQAALQIGISSTPIYIDCTSTFPDFYPPGLLHSVQKMQDNNMNKITNKKNVFMNTKAILPNAVTMNINYTMPI